MNAESIQKFRYTSPVINGIRTLVLLTLAAVIPAAAQRSFNTWTEYLGGADSSQYSSLNQINKSNVKQLAVAWSYPTGDTRSTCSIPWWSTASSTYRRRTTLWSRWTP